MNHDLNHDRDILIVGSGIAGLTTALHAHSAGLRVTVVTKATIERSATDWAQGGIAAAMDHEFDTPRLHRDDTMAAGAGLCDEAAVSLLVDAGEAAVEQLVAWGANFDQASGRFHLAREGGHSADRVVHAGGAATGHEIERALVNAVLASQIKVIEHADLVDLRIGSGHMEGIALRLGNEMHEVQAPHVVLATGGAGQMFSVTTNPPEATADGLAAAIRAGVAVGDLEFMQFHPTALHVDLMPRPLLSEALRGDGALLRDRHGERFVNELSSRDLVSRAMAAVMSEQGLDHLWLDVTPIKDFAKHFPTIAASLDAAGLDPRVDWLPVAPAAHHLAGGILTDLVGASAIPGLWAVGEVADSGVHGANRLASNSLLEGMVFAKRCVDALVGGQVGPSKTGVLGNDASGSLPHLQQAVPTVLETHGSKHDVSPEALLERLQATMTRGAGVVRSQASLEEAREAIASLRAMLGNQRDPRFRSIENLVTVSEFLIASALVRQESRGCHVREEFQAVDDAWRVRLTYFEETR
jgi:L-aspartate oxidase